MNAERIWQEKAGEFLDVVDNINNRDGMSVRKKVLYPKMKEHIGNITGKVLLDAGCGEGAIGRIALSEGAYVVGCDIVPQLLYEANLRSDRQENVVLANLRYGLPFATDSFDVVCYNLVLMWMPDITILAQEAKRVTNKEGKVVVSLLHPWTALSRITETDSGKPALLLENGVQNGTFMRTINKTAGPFPYYQRTITEYIDTFTREGFCLDPQKGLDEVSYSEENDVSLSKKLYPEFLILTFRNYSR